MEYNMNIHVVFEGFILSLCYLFFIECSNQLKFKMVIEYMFVYILLLNIGSYLNVSRETIIILFLGQIIFTSLKECVNNGIFIHHDEVEITCNKHKKSTTLITPNIDQNTKTQLKLVD